MATPKGYPSQEKEDRITAEFVTVSPIGPQKYGLDVKQKFHSTAASDAVEAGTTGFVIVATAHVARKGDMIRFTSGTHIGVEADVVSVDTNSITIGQTLSPAPSAADTFDILRPTSLGVSAGGGITTGPITFKRNGADQVVTEDTTTPANNRPLPVAIAGTDGTVTINSSNLNLEVQLDHSSANPDSVKIGDGVETVNVNASNEMQVRDDSANTSLASIDTDTGNISTNTSNIDGKMAAFDLDSGAGTENVQGVSLRLSNSGGSVEGGTATNPLRVDPTGSTTQPISASSLPLPTGAATETTLSTLNGKVTACDTGNVTIGAALPTGANTIGAVTLTDGVETAAINASNELLVEDANVATNTSGIFSDTTSLDNKIKANVINAGNSTTSVLGVGGTFTGSGTDVSAYQAVTIQLFADQDSAADGMKFQFSTDNTNWDESNDFNLDASVSQTRRFQFPVTAQYFRVVYTNGGVAQTAFRVQTILHTTNVLTSIHRLDTGLTNDRSVTVTKSVIAGETTAGGGSFVNVKVDPSGALQTNPATLDVVDFFDTPLLDASSSNIPGSAGSPLQVIASTAADVKKVQIYDTTGGFYGIYTGAAASEVLVAVVGPGSNETLELSIPSGTRISLLSLETSAITTGNVTMNFIG